MKLEELKFFEKQANAIDYINKKKLDLIKEKDLANYGNIQGLHELIFNYLSGKDINIFDSLKDLNIDLNMNKKFPTAFSLSVINKLANLNRGEITTYSEIGSKIGSRAYRAIGNVLRKNPLPLIIPCHRVIKKNGEIGGFMGESDESWQQNLKRNLLEIEQITNP
ncbi:MAG: methylated-DNA--[protein]-cysteine S-methyltransferase [Candidatus Lokiarchaeota archaeon]|nr:methylated-DNA--[protein]-cysteine S-methyltransferase [Candidatus Lokiarchaeota archaeon]